MELPEPTLLTYRQARDRINRIRTAEVPVEFAVSIPLPTARFGAPGYAQFAAPAVRRPEQPTSEQGPPDRWWVLDARGGRLIVYALSAAVPFAPAPWDRVTVAPPAATMDELRRLHVGLDAALDAVAPDFFAGRPGDPAARRNAVERLAAVIPVPLAPAYRALAPDFFNWLEA